MEEFPDAEKCNDQLTSKQSPEITADSGKGNQKEDACDAEQQSDRVDEERGSGMPQPI